MGSTEILVTVVVAIVAILAGIFLGKMIFAKNTQKLVDEAEARIKKAEAQAKKTIDDANTLAETVKEKKLLEAKEHFSQLKINHEKDVTQRNLKLVEAEARFKAQQQSLSDKTSAVQRQIQE